MRKRSEGWDLAPGLPLLRNNLIRNIVAILFSIAVFFPYIQIIPTETDIQPSALIVGAVIVATLVRFGNVPKGVLWLGGVFVFSVIAMLWSEWRYNTIRSIATYASLFVIPAATVALARAPILRHRRLLDAVVVIWFVVGTIQMFYDETFLTEILSNSRTTVTRGVTGLAAEPSFYGITCFVMLLMYYLQRRDFSIGAALCYLQILLYAKSPTTTAIVVVFLLVFAVCQSPLRVAATLAVCASVGGLVLSSPLMEDSRLMALARVVTEEPTAILLKDHSASSRFYHIVYSFKGCFEGFLMPRGYSAWGDYYEGQLGMTENRYLGYFVDSPERIMSALGTAAFELGIVGLLIPFIISDGVQHYYGTILNRRAIPFLGGLLVVLLNSVPLSYPPYGFLIGVLYSYRDRAGEDALFPGAGRNGRVSPTGPPPGMPPGPQPGLPQSVDRLTG